MKTGRVAARPRQAVDEAGSDGIADDREHDRHGAGSLQQRPHGRVGMGQNDPSGASVANSTACLRMASASTPAQRVSIRTLRPMVHAAIIETFNTLASVSGTWYANTPSPPARSPRLRATGGLTPR